MAALLVALGRGALVARLDGQLADVLHNSTYVVTAWDGATLVGAARVVSDRVACRGWLAYPLAADHSSRRAQVRVV